MAGSSHQLLTWEKKYPPPPVVFPLLPSSPEESHGKRPEKRGALVEILPSVQKKAVFELQW